MHSTHPLLKWFLGYEAKRKRALAFAPQGPLKKFLSHPFQADKTPFEELNLLAVDFETTGLNATTDKLLSVGFVELSNQQIKLSTNYHKIINTQQALVADNVAIHQITDEQKEQGSPLKVVVDELLAALAGKVMLVHFASIEKLFLRQACIEIYGMAPPLPIIDTLALAKKRLDLRDVAYDPSELRLTALRKRHKLPEYHAHNALNDAIATAELLLAQVSHDFKGRATLKDLLL